MTSPTPSEPRTGQQLYHAAALPLGVAVLLVGAAIFTIYTLQLLVHRIAGALVAQVIADSVTVLGVALFLRKRPGALGLRGTSLRFVGAALLIGLTAWYLDALIVVALQIPGNPKQLQAIVEETALLPTLAALTIFPAIAEELVFRGVLLRAVAARFGSTVAIVTSAGVFALYHLFPPQVVANFCLGLALGFVTLRARSVIPAMIIHVVNNTVAVLLSRDELPSVSSWIGTQPGTMLTIAAASVAGGVALASRGAA